MNIYNFYYFLFLIHFLILTSFYTLGQANSITDVSLTISSFSSSVEETTGSDLFFFFLPIYINIYILIYCIPNLINSNE